MAAATQVTGNTQEMEKVWLNKFGIGLPSDSFFLHPSISDKKFGLSHV